MTIRWYVPLLATAVGVSAVLMWCQQPASGAVDPTQSGLSAVRSGVFTPGLDDLMTMLVQPRHIRLYEAGKRANWELAAFELAELHSSFGRATQVIPKYQGIDVGEALKTIIEPKLAEVSKAISRADVTAFLAAYRDLTDACNACHTYLEHPFLVISVPGSQGPTTSSGDQAFAPAR
jgi:hypothetical protein